MRVLGLPGKDEATVSWLASILDQLSDSNSIHEYAFWSTSEEPNLVQEASGFDLSHFDSVVAKSLGTVIFLTQTAQESTPIQAALIGIPLFLLDNALKETLSAGCQSGRFLCIQQKSDPAGSADQLCSIVGRESVLEVPGSDHDYRDVESFIERVRGHFASGA